MEKKQSINPNARKEKVSENDAVRRDLLRALSAFPASSPSIPNSAPRRRDSFFFVRLLSPLPRTASMGHILPSFQAGIQAEIITVAPTHKSAAHRTSGW